MYLDQLRENAFFPTQVDTSTFGQVDHDDFREMYGEICDQVSLISIMLELAVSFSFLFPS